MARALDARARASMFFIAYTLDGVRDPRGGRSLIRSTAGWLQLGVAASGLLGPKRVQLDREGYAGAPPYALVDNEHSILTKRTWCSSTRLAPGYSAHGGGREGEGVSRLPAL